MSRVVCPVCGSPAARAFKLADRDVFGCHGRECGLRFAVPQPTDEKLTEYYARYYYGDAAPAYENTPEDIIQQLVHGLEQQTGNLAGKCVLDYGCGIGGMARALLSAGAVRVDGIESDAHARASVGRELGIAVAADLVELQQRQPSARYDLITMVDVIEHVRSPVDTLEQLSAVLAPGGAVFMETPDAESLKARLLRAAWDNYRNPTHLYYFSLRSMNRVLEAAGYASTCAWRPTIAYPAHGRTRQVGQLALQRLGLDGALRVIAYRPPAG
jgi:SAM-dependent methyltransferase